MVFTLSMIQSPLKKLPGSVKRYHIPSSEAKDLLMSQLFLAIMQCDVNTEQINELVVVLKCA